MQFHLLGLAQIPYAREYTHSAYVQLAIKFARMMVTRGHTVIVYNAAGYEEDIMHSEYVPVLERADYDTIKKMTDNYRYPSTFVPSEKDKTEKNRAIHAEMDRLKLLHWTQMLPAIRKRCKPRDIIVHIFGIPAIRKAFPKHIHVQCCCMGSDWTCCEYNVFISDFVLNESRRRESYKISAVSRKIQPWFYPEDFIYTPEKKPTGHPYQYLFFARCQVYKGLHWFLKLSQAFPEDKFLIAGGCESLENGIMKTGELVHMNGKDEPVLFDLSQFKNVEYLGCITSWEERAKLLAESTALIQLTCYSEPCAWNTLEAMYCGTAVLGAKSAGFLDSVVDGKTGVLVEVGPQVDIGPLLKQVTELKPQDCYEYARTQFSEDRAYMEYMSFFEKAVAHFNSLPKPKFKPRRKKYRRSHRIRR